MKLTNTQLLMLIGAGVLGAWYLKRRALGALNEVNPLNRENIFYTGVNGALSDDPNFSIGTWVYDLFHDDPEI